MDSILWLVMPGGDGTFEKAWRIVKGMPSWDDIRAAGAANDRGDDRELVRLIRLIDDLGESMSAERKAVDLMVNSGWSLEDTMDRMGNTFDSPGSEGEMQYDGKEGVPEHHIRSFNSPFERQKDNSGGHDRDALLPAERDLPGGDSFVGPRVSGHVNPINGRDIDYDYDVDENEDTGYDEHLDRNIAHQQDRERKRILAEGVPDHRSDKEGGLGDSGEYQNERRRD